MGVPPASLFRLFRLFMMREAETADNRGVTGRAFWKVDLPAYGLFALESGGGAKICTI